ncbi:alternative ribosome rescue aminoacyl-tRNA hydrolase ArfB [Alterisphingorhabdus coralli]|uniref:Alternative ribosome rescue aminoacyl-tRNA hydrolase ArfB n=1 Tax=Alterisphingorhabdus coralli TaxID=3071408 RepID=A0AA97F6Y1_9SPHN|nr:alternative ribosome rescue aminoacyl-tRNA hydrolase ArfB [Parasphingorhabdus sp. SCSIO 66989]WOE75088.1 alternative ribosome rescue aminoacyl-tRNA hydrolase ArfB [Parasphingorhabdus sp. SCSIO 66989]
MAERWQDIWETIPADAVSEQFITASGPGGQNVNKVATAAQLRINVFRLELAPPVYARLKSLGSAYLTNSGEMVITAKRHRTQAANRLDARERFVSLLQKARTLPAKRKKSRLNRVGKTKRLQGKKIRSAVKKSRGRVRPE